VWLKDFQGLSPASIYSFTSYYSPPYTLPPTSGSPLTVLELCHISSFFHGFGVSYSVYHNCPLPPGQLSPLCDALLIMPGHSRPHQISCFFLSMLTTLSLPCCIFIYISLLYVMSAVGAEQGVTPISFCMRNRERKCDKLYT
jgi:hypothetical protein